MAAAFAALLSLQNSLDLIRNHPLHSFSLEATQLESLAGTVRFLIGFMKSYNNSHGARREASEALEMRIARAAEAAEDVVETHVVDQIRGGKTRRCPTTRPRSRFLLDLQKVSQDLDYMRRKAVTVTVTVSIKVEAEQQEQLSHSAPPPTSNNTSPSTRMVGFGEVLNKLFDKLTGVPSSRRVIPIVGMGGIGKTTLVTNAFQDPLAARHFDVCLWATVSQQHKVENILTQLMSGIRKMYAEYFDASTSFATADERSIEMLHKSLWGRRYLIILDDMWSIEAWYAIKFFFPDTNNGSRIVVTTRSLDVANDLDISPIEMMFLDEGNSWDLFCQEAFEAEQGCPPQLQEIGKKIVGKCNGLPLAIVVAGGHLKKSSMALEYWENVAQHMNSILNSEVEEERCLDILALSYSYLPVHLKPCFLLMGAFLEDEKIFVTNIIRLWIAEGLIEPTENTSLEEVAKVYLMDLFQRNLVLVDGFVTNSERIIFKIHDLVREMCIKIAEKEGLFNLLASPHAMTRERRVVIGGEVAADMNHQRIQSFDAPRPIRFLMCRGGWPSCDLKLLRTLDRVVPASTSVSIFKQVNLRHLHLDLACSALKTFYLPSSISLLWNLQTLNIDLLGKSKVIAPYEIWEMLQLRHVDIRPVCLLDPLPVETNDLVLRNLRAFCRAENFRLSEEACKRIPNVREMHLSYCDEATSYYCLSNLCYLQKLEIFSCHFSLSSQWRQFALSLTFPSSIKSLFLGGCRLDWEEMATMVGSLPNLMTLQLSSHAAVGSVWSTVEGKFRSLKFLEILGCTELVHWMAESSHFPVLENLSLGKMYRMAELPGGIGYISTLRWIRMEYCNLRSVISAMKMLKEQEEEYGNEDLRLHVSLHCVDQLALELINDKVKEHGLLSNNLFLDLKVVTPPTS